MDSIKVSAPASIANIGCLFDLAAMAIDYARDIVEVSYSNKKGVHVEAIGNAPNGEKNTAYHVAIHFLKEVDMLDKIGIKIRVIKKIPTGVGLGSSGATCAATAYALNKLLKVNLDENKLIQIAGYGELASAGTPHFDNVSASLLGGITIIISRKPLRVIKLSPPIDLGIIVIIPMNLNKVPSQKKTEFFRKILPKEVLLDDMIEQCCATARFILSLINNDLKEMGKAVSQGGIVERVRGAYIDHYWDIKREVLNVGALGFNIAGAGPSMFLTCNRNKIDYLKEEVEKILKKYRIKAKIISTRVDLEGCREETRRCQYTYM